MDRGTCTFTRQGANAQAAGAIGVIIANNSAGSSRRPWAASASVTIPVLSVNHGDRRRHQGAARRPASP